MSARNFLAVAATAALLPGTLAAAVSPAHPGNPGAAHPATPIRHLVVLFQENVSFDHYFGTYPHAANTDGHPFHAKPGTPRANGLTGPLLTHNPNEYNPARLTPAQALTCDQDHGYTAEQQAFDGGLMDKFVQYTGNSDCPAPAAHPQGLVMDYFDGNTVTAEWDYAQRFAIGDNFHGTEFGESTAGALNLISGELHGANGMSPAGHPVRTDPGVVGSPDAHGTGTMYSDQDPFYDGCSDRTKTMLRMSGTNIGSLLTPKHVTWGWFEGGFTPTSRTRSGSPVCGSAHGNIAGQTVVNYVPHHEPFQYYRSTANPGHLPPASLAEVRHSGRANHQYDISWFFRALRSRKLPSVSFLKAPAYADGHAGYSSADPATDALNGTGICGHGTPLAGHQDRCGYGPRLPFLLISPSARRDYVDGTLTDQTSVLRFIEDNWLGAQRIGYGSFDTLAGSLNGMFSWRRPHLARLILNPRTGEPLA